MSTFFAFLLVAVASPFATQAAPADGAGMTPSLQNPYMLAHPPLLYLGYVGLTVPFAFAIGALLSGKLDERWLIATRRWTLFAWAALGVGQLLGSHWAYVEVGWGGYYAWDPVENAALMPWLAATAFLHSVMIQEKRGMLKVWNVLLVIIAFSLALFGTFLTRSGVVNSIHSFTQSSIGPWFLAFIAVTVAASLAIVFWRLPQLRSPTKLESAVSREAAFLYNNLLLLALCLAILWGVVYPMLSEAVRGEAVVLGRSYYDFFLRAFGLPLAPPHGNRASHRLAACFVQEPCDHLPLADRRGAGHRCRPPLPRRREFDSGPRRVHVLRLRPHDHRHGVRARDACAKGARGAVLARRVHLAHHAKPSPLRRLRRPRGDRALRDRCGRVERLRFGRRGEARARRVDADRGLHAPLPVPRRARDVECDADPGDARRAARRPRPRLAEAGKNAYTIEQQVSNEVGIRSDKLTGEDLFVIAEQIDPNGSVYFRVFVKPLVNLIWLAGLVFLLGS